MTLQLLTRLQRIRLQTVVCAVVCSGSGGGTWGSITGTLSNQTDLQNALNAKQDTLVSGTNIKTINGSTVLGSGDLAVSAAWGSITGTLGNQTDLQNALGVNGFGTIIKGATHDRYYGWFNSGYTPTTGLSGTNTMRAASFPVTKTMTLDAIQTEVVTGVGGSNFRLGIYADNGNCYPGALLHDTGSLSGASNVVVNSAISPGLVLTPGLYWFVIVADANITFRAVAGSAGWFTITGRNSTMGAAYRQPFWTVAFTYGTLPNPFTAGATINAAAVNIAEILVRASA